MLDRHRSQCEGVSRFNKQVRGSSKLDEVSAGPVTELLGFHDLLTRGEKLRGVGGLQGGIRHQRGILRAAAGVVVHNAVEIG